MPELPEVETIKRDLARRMEGKTIRQVIIRCASLRTPVRADLPNLLVRRKVRKVCRRAKYVLVNFTHGTMGIHLGMSGTVRADKTGTPPRKHDHIEWHLTDSVLRYHDPRRFGRVFWIERGASNQLLDNCGVEPLERGFTATFLHTLTRNRKQSIKTLLMDSSKIAGIGNIYSSEGLFRACVRPQRRAQDISQNEAAAIVRHTRQVLREAIKAGGSSLRDHTYGAGKPGYFQLAHRVYGRDSQPCIICGHMVDKVILGQRSSFYCPACQH